MATYENTRSFHALEIINPAGGAGGGAEGGGPLGTCARPAR
jgi:hypothetical protein